MVKNYKYKETYELETLWNTENHFLSSLWSQNKQREWESNVVVTFLPSKIQHTSIWVLLTSIIWEEISQNQRPMITFS